MKALYEHPDGEGSLRFDPDEFRLWLFNEAEYMSAYAEIGPEGLRDVAAKLLALADESEAQYQGYLDSLSDKEVQLAPSMFEFFKGRKPPTPPLASNGGAA